MSDRANSITVVLEDDYKVEDLENLMNAMRQFGGVIAVDANVSNALDFVAMQRAKIDMEQKVLKAIRED
jgi:hypothetical protein